MFQARYYKTDGSPGSEVSLPTALFDGVVNESVLHRVIKAYLANQRQGTGSGKSRGEVKGGSRKPWRQKGTGRARQGTIRAAQWRGGGLAFPPQPHSWNQRVPKKERSLARRSAFNDRAQAGRVVVVEGFDLEAPKTQRLMALLSSMKTQGKVLVLTHGVNSNVHLSGRNLPGVQVLPFGSESPYDVIWSGTVVIEEGALETVAVPAPQKDSPRRRAIDPQAMAEAVDAQASRKQAREKRLEMSRRIDAEDVDLSAPLLTKVASAPPRKKVAPAVKGKKEEKKQGPIKAAEKAPRQVPDAEVVEEKVAAPVDAPSPEEPTTEATPVDSSIDASAVALPKVADLADFLAGIDRIADVETLRDRDSRKTAAPLYAARIEELS